MSSHDQADSGSHGGKAYAIRIAATAINDLAGIGYAGILNDTTWNLTTSFAATPPTLVGTNIVDDKSGSPVAVNTLAPGLPIFHLLQAGFKEFPEFASPA